MVLQNINRVFEAVTNTIGEIKKNGKMREDTRVKYDHYRLKLQKLTKSNSSD
jgi:hypothetical protein